MKELRCAGNKLHGIIVDEDRPAAGTLEVRCGSQFCGAGSGHVVLHRFDLGTGEVTTREYLEPPKPRKE
jgi:hypothetical protein